MSHKNPLISRAIYPLYEMKCNQIKMVKARGYTIPSEEAHIFTSSVEDFGNIMSVVAQQNGLSIRSMLTNLYRAPDGRTIYVYYGSKLPTQKQLAAEIIRDFTSKVLHCQATEAIIVVDAPVSAVGMEELSELATVKWQIFNDKELMMDPSEHIGVDEHIKLSPQEKADFLLQTRVGETQLPLISIEDPIVRYYNWGLGSIIKILRYDTINPAFPATLNYRIVS